MHAVRPTPFQASICQFNVYSDCQRVSPQSMCALFSGNMFDCAGLVRTHVPHIICHRSRARSLTHKCRSRYVCLYICSFSFFLESFSYTHLRCIFYTLAIVNDSANTVWHNTHTLRPRHSMLECNIKIPISRRHIFWKLFVKVTRQPMGASAVTATNQHHSIWRTRLVVCSAHVCAVLLLLQLVVDALVVCWARGMYNPQMSMSCAFIHDIVCVFIVLWYSIHSSVDPFHTCASVECKMGILHVSASFTQLLCHGVGENLIFQDRIHVWYAYTSTYSKTYNVLQLVPLWPSERTGKSNIGIRISISGIIACYHRHKMCVLCDAQIDQLEFSEQSFDYLRILEYKIVTNSVGWVDNADKCNILIWLNLNNTTTLL